MFLLLDISFSSTLMDFYYSINFLLSLNCMYTRRSRTTIYHQHQSVLPARDSQGNPYYLSLSLLVIALGESSGFSELMNIFGGWTAIVCHCVGVHWWMSLMFLTVPNMSCLYWFICEIWSGCTAAVLWGAASRICSKQHTASCVVLIYFFLPVFH